MHFMCKRGFKGEPGGAFFNLLLSVSSQLFLAFGIGHEPVQDPLGIWQNGPGCVGTKDISDVFNLCQLWLIPC